MKRGRILKIPYQIMQICVRSLWAIEWTIVQWQTLDNKTCEEIQQRKLYSDNEYMYLK